MPHNVNKTDNGFENHFSKKQKNRKQKQRKTIKCDANKQCLNTNLYTYY